MKGFKQDEMEKQ